MDFKTVSMFLYFIGLAVNVSLARHYDSDKKAKGTSYHGSRVALASGGSYFIPDPHTNSHPKCPTETVRVELRPHGHRNKEYNKIKKEVERSGLLPMSFDIHKIEKLENSCLWNRYQLEKRDIIKRAGDPNERMLFHGSPSVMDIIETGFDERYAKQGFFGFGLYFAAESSKSNRYTVEETDGTSKLLLCRVALGKTETDYLSKKYAHAPPGYDSVTSGLFSLKEYVVYRGEQVYPEYLITYTAKIGF